MRRFALCFALSACAKPVALQSAVAAVASPPQCAAPPAAVRDQLTRMLTAAAEHGSWSATCSDGNGRLRSVDEVVACADGKTVALSYRVRTEHQHGGECTPYPECAKSDYSEHRYKLTLSYRCAAAICQAPAPNLIPGLEEARYGSPATPLAARHDGGCLGTKAAFTEALRW